MDSYQIFLVTMGDTKLQKNWSFKHVMIHKTQNIERENARNDLDNEKATENSESPSDQIE